MSTAAGRWNLVRDAGLGLALTSVYFAFAKLGLSLAFVQANASPVWAPAGIALAALLLGGLRYWPGVFLGAYLANLTTAGTPGLAAILIAAGNTLAAVIPAHVLRSRLGFDPALRRWKDLLGLIGVGVLLGPLVSATNGTAQIVATGGAPAAVWKEIWLVWYSGDALGILLISPFLLAWWARRRRSGYLPLTPESAFVFVGVIVSTALVFWRDVSGSLLGTSLALLVFPFGAWAAVRFGVRGTTSASLLIATVSVLGTVLRQGPFAAARLHEQLFQFQIFIVVLSASGLLLAALSEERMRVELALLREVEERRRAEAALEKAKDLAEEAARAKSAILASMSHELRTPLNSIIGFGTVVLNEMVGPLNAEQKKQLGWAQESARHLLRQINEVLDLTRLETGQLEVTAAPFDLRTSLESCAQQVTPSAVKKGLQLRLDVAPEVGVVVSDRRRVEQVVLTLLGNAVKFTESGGVLVRCALDGGSVVTSIIDTGIGIAEDEQGRLFRPFQQVDSGLARRFEGIGLGLSISKGLLELLGGEIWLTSECGKGAAFNFRLPLAGGRAS